MLFVTCLVMSAQQQAPVSSPQTRRVCITVDDLPGVLPAGAGSALQRLTSNTEALLKGFKSKGVPAIGFVNEQGLYANGEINNRVKLLEAWLEAGMALGNHTFSHPDFNKVTLAQYEDEFVRGDTVTRHLMRARHTAPKYFRYPFNHTGTTKEVRDAFQKFAAERGYAIAPFTFDSSDWMFNAVYEAALARGDSETAKRAVEDHLKYLRKTAEYAEIRSREMFGREIPQIFIMHANSMNAVSIDALIKTFEERGYKFVSLEEALKDPAYATADAYAGPSGMSWLHRWAPSLGMMNDVASEPEPPTWVYNKYEEWRADRRAKVAAGM